MTAPCGSGELTSILASALPDFLHIFTNLEHPKSLLILILQFLVGICNISLFVSHFPLLLAFDSVFLDLPKYVLRSSFTIFKSQYKMKIWDHLFKITKNFRTVTALALAVCPESWGQCDYTGCAPTELALHFTLLCFQSSTVFLVLFTFQLFYVLIMLCLKNAYLYVLFFLGFQRM